MCVCVCLDFADNKLKNVHEHNSHVGAEQEGSQRRHRPASGGELAVEPDAGAAANAGGAVSAGDADAVGGADSAHNVAATAVRQDRGQECVLLVPEPQGEGAAEAAAAAGDVVPRRA